MHMQLIELKPLVLQVHLAISDLRLNTKADSVSLVHAGMLTPADSPGPMKDCAAEVTSLGRAQIAT